MYNTSIPFSIVIPFIIYFIIEKLKNLRLICINYGTFNMDIHAYIYIGCSKKKIIIIITTQSSGLIESEIQINNAIYWKNNGFRFTTPNIYVIYIFSKLW